MFLLNKLPNLIFLKNHISLFMMIFFVNNLLVSHAKENSYLVQSNQEENKLEKFYSQNPISYSQYDKVTSQLKIFFGYDPDLPNNSHYPDLSIIDDSDSIRNMYEIKLYDMTINKKIYNINK